jgi:hypothetical protein
MVIPLAMAWASSRAAARSQPHLAGMMANAVPRRLRRRTQWPATVIRPAGNCCLAGWLGPPEDDGVADGFEDDGPDAAGEPPG